LLQTSATVHTVDQGRAMSEASEVRFVASPTSEVVDQREALTELPVWDPIFAFETPWQELLNEHLVKVLRGWLAGSSFTRKGRRAFERLNLRMRRAAEAEEPLSPE
jgi:hypothetical protein